MHAILSELIQGFSLSGSIPEDAAAFLKHHKCNKTAAHVQDVAATAAKLAPQFGLNAQKAAQAGWMHDISAVFPKTKRLQVSRQLGLKILPEEASVPLLLHQKISTVIASQIFSVKDQEVLSAIDCHTTLKSQPSQMDLLLFAADKLSWDQKGTPPYARQMEEALSRSLEEAAWVYQNYLWNSGKIKVIHPWMRDSYLALREKFA